MPTFSQVTLYSRFGVVSTIVRGRANSKSTLLEGEEPGRVEMLDHLDHGGGVEPFQPAIAVHERALNQLDALDLVGGGGDRASGGPGRLRVR